MSGSCGELIISPEELACIQAACQRRAAELAREAATAALQVDRITAESPQCAPAALPAPSLVSLASAFWQALLYGSRDALGMRTLLCVWSRVSYPWKRMCSGNSPTASGSTRYARCWISSSEQKSGMLWTCCCERLRLVPVRPHRTKIRATVARSTGLSALHAGPAPGVPSRGR